MLEHEGFELKKLRFSKGGKHFSVNKKREDIIPLFVVIIKTLLLHKTGLCFMLQEEIVFFLALLYGLPNCTSSRAPTYPYEHRKLTLNRNYFYYDRIFRSHRDK